MIELRSGGGGCRISIVGSSPSSSAFAATKLPGSAPSPCQNTGRCSFGFAAVTDNGPEADQLVTGERRGSSPEQQTLNQRAVGSSQSAFTTFPVARGKRPVPFRRRSVSSFQQSGNRRSRWQLLAHLASCRASHAFPEPSSCGTRQESSDKSAPRLGASSILLGVSPGGR